MMSEMEKSIATPRRKSSVSMRNKEFLCLQPPPSLLVDGTPTPHPTPRFSPSPPVVAAAADAFPHTQHLQQQLPPPPLILSPSSSTRRSRRAPLGKPRSRTERLSSSSSSLLMPSRLCIDDPLLDSPPLRGKKCKNGCSPGSRASPIVQRSSRRASRRMATAAALIEKEEKEFGDVSAPEDESNTKKSSRHMHSKKVDAEVYKTELDSHDINLVGQWLYDLIMWKDIAKSSLWFGFGSLCFLASGCAKGISFSFVSVTSQLALLLLAAVFLYNSFPRREKDDDFDTSESRNKLVVRQENVTYAVQMVVQVLNTIIPKIRELFSGDPSMTLKVAPVLFIASEYGHVLSLWRLFATGFFLSFAIPKMYSYYAEQLHSQVGNFRSWIQEAWSGCGHKRILATSATTIFWNVSSIRTRFFVAFMFAVLLQFYRQCSQSQSEAENGGLAAVETVEEEEAVDQKQ